MLRCMRRTNIYLTEAQQRALEARARQAGSNRSAVLREILDAGLGAPGPVDDELRAGFAALADRYDQLTAGLFGDDPDLRIDA
jgi:hypothetical protein